MSTANNFNGADLGVRQEWLPLFDKYGVDLVVMGHEHHYERTLPVRGHADNQTLTPIPRATNTDVINTELGTVHMIIGGGGTSAPSNQLLFDPPQCRVIVSVGVARQGAGLRLRGLRGRPGPRPRWADQDHRHLLRSGRHLR